jgi:predicted HTH transcriptional regulator
MAKDMSKLLEIYEGDAEEENEVFSEKPQRKKEKNKDESEEENENKKIKLDLKDRKILALLDEDSRLSNSQIAKRVGLSKPAIEYRLKRFEKNNVIFSFYTVIDFTKLGYSEYKVYFNFQNTDLEDEKKIIDY